MSMRIQEMVGGCCDGIKSFASSAAEWMHKTVTAAGSWLSETAQKVMEFVKPYFESARDWASANREYLIVGAVAAAVGAVCTAIIYNVCCKETATPAATTGAPATATA